MPLHSRTNQELYEKYLCNQSSHYEKYEKYRVPLDKGVVPINHCLKSFNPQQYESRPAWKAPL